MTPRTRATRRAHATRARRPAAYEALEPRTTRNADGGPDPEVTINGTTGNDLIVIERTATSMRVTVNGVVHGIATNIVNVTVDASGGADEIRLNGADRDLQIDGGSGDDRLIVAQASGNLGAIDTTFDFFGGSGNDSVQLWDDRPPAGTNLTYTVTANDVWRPGMFGQTWGAVERVELRTSGGSDVFRVEAVAATTGLEIFAGDGADAFDLGYAGNNLDALAGPITLHGGAGNDPVRLIDGLNTLDDAWTITQQGAARRAFQVAFDDVSPTLLGGSGNERFDVESTSVPLWIYGGPGDDGLRITPAGQNTAAIAATVDFDQGPGSGMVNVDDRQASAPTTWVIGAASLTRNGVTMVNYAGMRAAGIVGGTGGDTFRVPTGLLTALLSGGPGDDTYVVGDGNAAGWNEYVQVGEVPGGGFDRVTIDDSAATAGHYFSMTYDGVWVNSGNPIVRFTHVEEMTLKAGAGADEMHVNDPGAWGIDPPALNISAGAGGDDIYLTGEFDNVTIDGQGGADFVSLEAPSSPSYTLAPGTVDAAAARLLTYNNVEVLTFRDAPDANTITVTNTAPGTLLELLVGGGSNVVRVLETAPFSPLTVVGTTSYSTLEANLDGVGSANLKFVTSTTFSNVALGAGARVTLAPNAGIRMEIFGGGLTVAPGAILDLTDNELLHVYGGPSPIETYRALLAQGYAGGTWAGGGITSSQAGVTPGHALGYAESVAADGPGEGGPYPAILVRYTRYGDANLDGVVNLNDFNRLAAHFGASGAHWDEGNFNFDGNVNLNDFNLLAAHFGQAAGAEDAGIDADDEGPPLA